MEKNNISFTKLPITEVESNMTEAQETEEKNAITMTKNNEGLIANFNFVYNLSKNSPIYVV